MPTKKTKQTKPAPAPVFASLDSADATQDETPLEPAKRKVGRPPRNPDLSDPNDADVSVAVRISKPLFRALEEMPFDKELRERLGVKTRSDALRVVIRTGIEQIAVAFDREGSHRAELLIDENLRKLSEDRQRATRWYEQITHHVNRLLPDRQAAAATLQGFVHNLFEMQPTHGRDWLISKLKREYGRLLGTSTFASAFTPLERRQVMPDGLAEGFGKVKLKRPSRHVEALIMAEEADPGVSESFPISAERRRRERRRRLATPPQATKTRRRTGQGKPPRKKNRSQRRLHGRAGRPK